MRAVVTVYPFTHPFVVHREPPHVQFHTPTHCAVSLAPPKPMLCLPSNVSQSASMVALVSAVSAWMFHTTSTADVIWQRFQKRFIPPRAPCVIPRAMRAACVLLLAATLASTVHGGTFVPYVCTGGGDGSKDGYLVGVPGSDARLVVSNDKTGKGLQIGDTEVRA